MLQSVSLSALQPAAANPRRKIDRKAIEGLAASIRTDGVLHNLVVSPVEGKGKKERFQIVSGSRRLRGAATVAGARRTAGGFHGRGRRYATTSPRTTRCGLPPSRICNGRIITPLEEAGALTKLVHKGVTLDDVVAQTGLSATTIKRRLALNNLCREAKAALTKGVITLSQAEALTLGSDEAQTRIVEQIADGGDYSADDIKGDAAG